MEETPPHCSGRNHGTLAKSSRIAKCQPQVTAHVPHSHDGTNDDDDDGRKSVTDDAVPHPKRPKLGLDRHGQFPRPPTEGCWVVVIKILSASYGPSESVLASGSNGQNVSEESARVPLTRDCAPFLRALLMEARDREEYDRTAAGRRQYECPTEQNHDGISPGTNGNGPQNPADRTMHAERSRTDFDGVRLSSTVDGQSKTFIGLLGGGGRRSMNAYFGDPCPGTSKRLLVHYMVTEIYTPHDDLAARAARTEIYHAIFAEHERVALRRRPSPVLHDGHDTTTGSFHVTRKMASSVHGGPQWHLHPATSEVVLPILLPFLEIRERVQCRMVCQCWKRLVRQWGVATTIDVNDRSMMINTTPPSFSRPVLRGILAHSYTSLQSLFLGGFTDLQQDDLHPALLQLQNLNTLDVTRCAALDDTTMQLLATDPLRQTLRVLYLKGLRNVTDDGLQVVCDACTRLEVLDISHIGNITDHGARAIQQLEHLRALFLRDNYRLTNESLDVITQKCVKLVQLTLWGCIGMQHLQFATTDDVVRHDVPSSQPRNFYTNERITMLNLWGCYNLGDDTAHVVGNMPNLTSLIVSECHRLTDQFVQTLVTFPGIQQGLQHLHLRYLKRITDASIVAIGQNLNSSLYSLDLSFCSRLTAVGIYQLLESCRRCLGELRLTSCRTLQIGQYDEDDDAIQNRRSSGTARRPRNNRDHAGHWILNAIRRPYGTTLPVGDYGHALCLLDVRDCGGQPAANVAYRSEDPFVVGMVALQFEQKIPGFFARPAKHCMRRYYAR